MVYALALDHQCATTQRGLTSIIPTMSPRLRSQSRRTRTLSRRLLRPFERFIGHAAFGGLLLFGSAAVALLWANSPWTDVYSALWHMSLAGSTLGHWVNDGLMTVFFLLVGLEIKREILVGELASWRQAALPMISAAGGMLVPALTFALVARGTPAIAGWGVPMATDIAFALGVLTLLGPRVPLALKVFLSALAIVDDVGAVLVIALFYTPQLNLVAMGAVCVLTAALCLCNLSGVRRPAPYLALGVLLWVAVLQSGVHATIAGVLLALTIPAKGRHAPLQRIEQALHAPIAYIVMPLFALANAGIVIPTSLLPLLLQPAALGTILGLVVGKPVGIFGAALIAVRLRIADRPRGTSWSAVAGVAVLGGIGFTMSLFIAALAFGDAAQLLAAKVGVIGGSLLAGSLGYALLWRRLPAPVAPASPLA